MHFALDIDQTICGSNAYEIYAQFHIHDLNLPIDPSILTQLASYRDFFLLPQVVAFRLSNENAWNASRQRAIATPWVIEAFSPIVGAREGVDSLSCSGNVRYYTARTPLVREATQHWLERYSFAQSQEVICCASIEQKIRVLAGYEPDDEPIVLIDDRGHTHLLRMLERMQGERAIRALLQRLTIVAFGTSTLPETTLCR